METESSLQQSQLSANCPYPEPARSIPYPNFALLKIQINIILPSASGSSKWSPSFKLPHQNPVYASPLTYIRYMPHLPHYSRFYPPKNLGDQYRSLSSSLLFSPRSSYLIPLRHKYSPQHPILKHPQPTFRPQFERPSVKPIQNNRQNYTSV